MHIVAALVWPALALVFAFAFAGLWFADRSRSHLLGFGTGFFALFLAMTVIIAFPWITGASIVASLHGLACISVIAIAWGTTARLNQRIPLFAMGSISLTSCILLFLALDDAEHPVAVLVQNGSTGLLFGIGAVCLWMARSTNVLDRVLVWTMSLLAALSILRPVGLLYLDVEFTPLVERQASLGAINIVVLTVLTAILGIALIAIAIQEALEISHSGERSDPVSGFLDQRTFEQLCEPAFSTARRLNMPVALAVLQLDWFEKIMDKWGPDTSDMVLREVSDVIRSWQRDSDVIGRVGEDQFAILFVGVGASSAQDIIFKLREDVNAACNDRMSDVLKFTLSSSILEATPRVSFKALLKGALTPLTRSRALGSSISFLNGAQMQHSTFSAGQDGTFVSLG